MLDIFRPSLIRTTLLVTFAYFTHVSCYYFFMKWIPKIVVDLGFEASSAADILIWAMLGGATGGAPMRLGMYESDAGGVFSETLEFFGFLLNRISEPVPVAHMTGASAAMVVTTVMIFGRTRSTAPCMVAS